MFGFVDNKALPKPNQDLHSDSSNVTIVNDDDRQVLQTTASVDSTVRERKSPADLVNAIMVKPSNPNNVNCQVFQ